MKRIVKIDGGFTLIVEDKRIADFVSYGAALAGYQVYLRRRKREIGK